MNSNRAVILLISFFLVQFSFAQKKKAPKLSKADNTTVTNLQATISYLANDKLEEEEPVLTAKKLLENISVKNSS